MPRRRWLLALAMLVTAVGVPVALAGPPNIVRFTNSDTQLDTSSCSFPVTFSFDVKGTGMDFFDRQGNFVRAQVHLDVAGTDTANGNTLVETDHYTQFFDAVGGQALVGLAVHVRLPHGGVVIRDAGIARFDSSGAVTIVRGPHPLLEGDTTAFCAALS